MAIKKLHIVCQRLEAVGESFGNEQGRVVVGRKYLPMPGKKCWRSMSQIDRHVVNFTAQARHQFHFRIWRLLKMHAAHSTFLRRDSMVDLDNGLGPTGRGQFFCTEKP